MKGQIWKATEIWDSSVELISKNFFHIANKFDKISIQ